MTYISLIGDSIFDNKAYVGRGELDTIGRVREILRQGERAALVAVDGHVVTDVYDQIDRIPDKTTHLVLSVGGNDALAEIDILNMNVESSAEVLDELYAAGQDFHNRYAVLVRVLKGVTHNLALSTIYYPNFTDEDIQQRATAALSVFNNAILHVATEHGLPVIDLRLICNEVGDYANAIEPSSAGSKKIAKAIRIMVDEHDFNKKRTIIYT